MMDRAIIIITDFLKQYWKAFIENDRTMKCYSKKVDNNYKTDILLDNTTQPFCCIFQNLGILQQEPDYNAEHVKLILERIDLFQDKTNIAIASHATGGKLSTDELSKDKTYHYELFHHDENDPIWTRIKALFNNVTNSNDYAHNYDKLWHTIVRPSKEANRLRAEILTCFIPFHFAMQEVGIMDGEWQTLLRNAQQKMSGLQSMVQKLDSLSDNKREGVEHLVEDIRILCDQAPLKDVDRQAIIEKIESLAVRLEDIVREMELME